MAPSPYPEETKARRITCGLFSFLELVVEDRAFDIADDVVADNICFGDFCDNTELDDGNVQKIADRIFDQMTHCRNDHGAKRFASLWLCGTSDDDIAMFCDDLMSVASMGIDEKDEDAQQQIDAVFYYLLNGLKKLRQGRPA